MNRILMLCLLGMMMAASLQAQTRRVGHRSHSGSPATFAMMMGEDHLGLKDPTPRVIYHVDPFVAKVRAHYEKVAKSIPEPLSAENQHRSKIDSIPTKSFESDPVKVETPVLDPPKENKKSPTPIALTQDIPGPDFLVKARPEPAPTVVATEGASKGSNLWLLVGLLVCTVAPGIVVASTLMHRSEHP